MPENHNHSSPHTAKSAVAALALDLAKHHTRLASTFWFCSAVPLRLKTESGQSDRLWLLGVFRIPRIIEKMLLIVKSVSKVYPKMYRVYDFIFTNFYEALTTKQNSSDKFLQELRCRSRPVSRNLYQTLFILINY